MIKKFILTVRSNYETHLTFNWSLIVDLPGEAGECLTRVEITHSDTLFGELLLHKYIDKYMVQFSSKNSWSSTCSTAKATCCAKSSSVVCVVGKANLHMS